MGDAGRESGAPPKNQPPLTWAAGSIETPPMPNPTHGFSPGHPLFSSPRLLLLLLAICVLTFGCGTPRGRHRESSTSLPAIRDRIKAENAVLGVNPVAWKRASQ